MLSADTVCITRASCSALKVQ